MEHIWFKNVKGNHFYRKQKGTWLHVKVQEEDAEYVQYGQGGLRISSFSKAGSACINDLEMISGEIIEISEDEFNEKLRQAIFSLEIYETFERIIRRYNS